MNSSAPHAMENKTHEQLYGNIYLLTFAYPPTEDFKLVFKKDMFYKNNKAAFHQVVHYLLSILNPLIIREKIPTWPIFEIKSESQFRIEVMKYMNELNNIYEDANIPIIKTAHLISPGGLKFARCMLNLSQLVLYQHLQKNCKYPNTMLCPPKPNKNSKHAMNTLSKLKAATDELNKGLFNMNANFEADLNQYKNEATNLITQQNELTQKMANLKAILENQKKDGAEEDSLSKEEFEQKFKQLQEAVKQISLLQTKFESCSKLTDYLISKDICLEYESGEIMIPQEISHIVNPNAQNINLLKLLEGFIIFIEHQHFKLNKIGERDIDINLNKFTELNQLLETLIGNSNEIKDNFVEFLSNINDTSDQNTKVSSDSILALPLIDN